MTELISLGFGHHNPNYKSTYELLQELKPQIVTLELSVLETKRYLNYIKGQETELEAGYVFAKEKNLPLFAIDSPYAIESDFAVNPPDLKELTPGKVIEHNLTNIKDSLFKLYPEYQEYFSRYTCRFNSLQKRNEFMAQALDLLAQSYQPSLIVHIGGANHVILNNDENATPVHRLTKQFDEVSGRILLYNRFTKEYLWMDGIDKKIKKRFKKERYDWAPSQISHSIVTSKPHNF